MKKDLPAKALLELSQRLEALVGEMHTKVERLAIERSSSGDIAGHPPERPLLREQQTRTWSLFKAS